MIMIPRLEYHKVCKIVLYQLVMQGFVSFFLLSLTDLNCQAFIICDISWEFSSKLATAKTPC